MEHLFPLDVIARARLLLDQIPGGVGAYRCDLASTTGIYQPWVHIVCMLSELAVHSLAVRVPVPL